MSVRPATHAGLWYSNNTTKLDTQLSKLFKDSKTDRVKGARVLIGPHAGYSYSGQRLAETFKAWDAKSAKRIFLLGPSHHVYFKNNVLVSQFAAYETPFGDLPVDTEIVKELKRSSLFKYMGKTVDEDEHSFEMHAPFIKWVLEKELKDVSIIPLLLCDLDSNHIDQLAETLLPYVDDPENHFVVSSDFCHWGARFGYTEYLVNPLPLLKVSKDNIITLKPGSKPPGKIHKSIERLDSIAMKIASEGTYSDWVKYIHTTGNTICGQRPIAAILLMLERYGSKEKFSWIGYSQSSLVIDVTDSSVSYASGYVKLD